MAVILVLGTSILVGLSPASGKTPTWTMAPPPISPAFDNPAVSIGEVTCPTASTCVAVGSYRDADDQPIPFIATKGPSGWRTAVQPLPAGAVGETLDQVACANAVTCLAVGGGGLVDVEVNGHWSITEGGASSGESVGCDPSGTCSIMIGDGVPNLLVYTEKDGVFKTSLVPLPAGARAGGSIQQMTCPSAGGCIAVGYYYSPAGDEEPLMVKQVKGGWSLVNVVTPKVAGQSSIRMLSGVSCPAAGACTAVGSFGSNFANGGFALEQNGTRWRSVLLPQAGGYTADTSYGVQVNAVSCTSAHSCVAVGSYSAPVELKYPMILTETGGKWKAAEAPVPPRWMSWPAAASADEVACSGPGTCVVIENHPLYYTQESASALLVDKAGMWTVASPPVPASAATPNEVPQLQTVACGRFSSCYALGSYLDGEFATVGLSLRIGAGRLSSAPLELPPGVGAPPAVTFGGVSCPLSGKSCVTVGAMEEQHVATVTQPSVIGVAEEVRAGGVWKSTYTLFPVPNLPAGGAVAGDLITGVSCASDAFCVAVGEVTVDESATAGEDLPFAVVLSGGVWSYSPMPRPKGASGGNLTSVSCGAPGSCVATGYDSGGGGTEALLLVYRAGEWTIAPTPLANESVSSLGSSSCPTATWCLVTGQRQLPSDKGNMLVALDDPGGGAWRSITPNSTLGPNLGPEATSCWAVAHCAVLTGAVMGTVKVVNGSKISDLDLSLGITVAGHTPLPMAMSCPRATLCEIAGNDGGRTFLASGNPAGTELDQSFLPLTGGAYLSFLSCGSARLCAATGLDEGIEQQGYVVTETGGTFTETTLAPPAGASYGQLEDVGCSPAGECVADGQYVVGTTTFGELATYGP